MTNIPDPPSAPPKPKQKQGGALEREGRLAASLKRNIARRKAQSKGREAPASDSSESSQD
jgi:hypothetical protein